MFDEQLALSMGREYLRTEEKVSLLALKDYLIEEGKDFFFFHARSNYSTIDMYELGKKGPFARTIEYPIEVKLYGVVIRNVESMLDVFTSETSAFLRSLTEARVPIGDQFFPCKKIMVSTLIEGGLIEASSLDQTLANQLVLWERKNGVDKNIDVQPVS